VQILEALVPGPIVGDPAAADCLDDVCLAAEDKMLIASFR